MDKLLPFIWVLGVAVVYGAAWLGVTQFLGAVRRRKGWIELLVIASLTLAAVWIPLAYPWRFFAIAGVGGTLLVIYRRFRVPRAHTGPEFRDRREDRRQAALHLALATGGCLFVVPFVWLITTSLKEDEEIFRFPPVWIPKQQVQVPYGSRQVGVAQLKRNGQTVIQLAETETHWTVLPYSLKSNSTLR